MNNVLRRNTASLRSWSSTSRAIGSFPSSQSIRPFLRRNPCGSILSIAWVGDKAVGAECHVNPSLNEYIETDISTGQTTRDLFGYDFTPSPDGKQIAHVGWIVHFAPPFAQSNYLQIDHTTIYPLPDGMGPVEQKDLTEPPNVVYEQGLTYSGIHEFTRGLLWSPDSQRIALIDCTYDWTANHPGAVNAAGEGVASNRHCGLAVVSRGGQAALFPLGEVPLDDLRLLWVSPRQLSLRSHDMTKTITVP